jgi:hypothetical protein
MDIAARHEPRLICDRNNTHHVIVLAYDADDRDQRPEDHILHHTEAEGVHEVRLGSTKAPAVELSR